MAIKFSQFNLRTESTPTMYLVGYDGNQNIHITVDNLISDIIDGTENTIAMFGPGGNKVIDSMVTQNADANLLTVGGQLNVDEAATFDTSVTVTGDSTLNGNVTLGNETADIITQTGTLYLNGPVKDTTDTLGIEDQILVSDASGELTFTDLADIAVGSAEVVEVPVKNLQGSALTKGDPVYISGSVGASGRLEVKLADASNAAKMPALGLLKQNLGIGEEGFAVVTGKLRNLVTSPIDGQPSSANDVIYVKAGGTTGAALTLTKPTGADLIQNMGKVGRASTSNDGTFVVSSILRTNDIPNLTPGKIWVGSTGNTIESSTVHLDEATGRMGIGASDPTTKLKINGASHDSTFTAGSLMIASDSDTTLSRMFIDSNNIDAADSILFLNDYSRNAVMLGGDLQVPNGDVGIGTTTPGAKLEVNGSVRVTGTGLDVGYGNNSSNFVQIGKGRTIDGNARIDLIGDTTYTDYGFRLSRQNGGANADSTIRHRGTGLLNLNAVDAGTIILKTSDLERVRIDSEGNVGIGTIYPSAKLHVGGGVTIGGDASIASAINAGTLRYRTLGNNSYVDMCMKTGVSTYAWVNIVQNNW